MIDENIKDRLEKYEKEFKPTEISVPLVIIAEILSEIDIHLENISNKLWQ